MAGFAVSTNGRFWVSTEEPQVQCVWTHIDLPRPLDPATFYANSVEHVGVGPRRKHTTAREIAQIDFALCAVTELEPNPIVLQWPHLDDLVHVTKSPAVGSLYRWEHRHRAQSADTEGPFVTDVNSLAIASASAATLSF